MFKKDKNTQLTRRQPVSQPSSKVFSYHSSRSNPDASRARYEQPTVRNQKSEFAKYIPTYLAAIVIFGTLLYASVVNTSPRVQVLASESGASVQQSDDVYATFISDQLKQSLTNRSKLTFNAENTISALQKQFPEIDSAVITLPLIGHRPIVNIAVASPQFLLATSQGTFYVDSSGKPLLKASDASKPADLPTVVDETGLPIELGKQVLPLATTQFISQLLQHLQSVNVPIETIVLPLELNEVRLRVQGTGYVVRFNSTEDARTQVGTYVAVKERLEGRGEVPVEYIDVRVEERAFYK